MKSIRLSDIGAGFDRSTSSALACRPTKTYDVPSAQRVTVRYSAFKSHLKHLNMPNIFMATHVNALL